MKMKLLSQAAAAVMLVFAAAFPSSCPAQEKPFYLTGNLPGGFESVNPVAVYTPDNLYEYINGQAVFYLSYRFSRLEHGHYKKGDAEYYVDIYELGSPLSAFGAFRQQREAGAEALDAGAEGAITDYLAVLYKGRYYVEIIPMSSGEEDVPNMKQLAAHVDGILPGSDTIPPETALFPQSGLEAGSERYVDENLASYGFLGKGLSAMYDLPGQDRQSRVFISMWDNADSARVSFGEYKGRLTETAPVSISGVESLKGAEPYRGTTIVAQQGAYVFGMHSAANEAAAVAILEELAAKLKQ